MTWFWTDDLARALVDAGVVERTSVESWIARPVAIAGLDDADPLELARRELGIPPSAEQNVA